MTEQQKAAHTPRQQGEQGRRRGRGAGKATASSLDSVDRLLIDVLQGGFPLSPRPYAEVGATLGIDEGEVIARLQGLLATGVLTRFGPMFQVERAGGAFCLAAMAVPEADWARVLRAVNRHDAVAHNYRREHRLNMWFVLATADPADIARRAADIEHETGLPVWRFPKEREYFVGMRLSARAALPAAAKASDAGPPAVAMGAAAPVAASAATPRALDELGYRLVRATQAGLPLQPAPYAALAATLAIDEAALCRRLQTMLDDGVIRRIGAVPNHYALGYVANGMSVWDVADDAVDAAGERIGALPFVTHCYRRPRHLPDWPYNLFAMVHGADRNAVLACVAEIQALLRRDFADALRQREVLFSTAILKKTGLRLSGA